MSAFRDMVSRDIDRVVLNAAEHGEQHRIGGKKIMCVIDDATLRIRQGGAEYAVGQSYVLLYAKVADLPGRSGYGTELMIDGIPYIVETWDEDEGLATITAFTTMNS